MNSLTTLQDHYEKRLHTNRITIYSLLVSNIFLVGIIALILTSTYFSADAKSMVSAIIGSLVSALIFGLSQWLILSQSDRERTAALMDSFRHLESQFNARIDAIAELLKERLQLLRQDLNSYLARSDVTTKSRIDKIDEFIETRCDDISNENQEHFSLVKAMIEQKMLALEASLSAQLTVTKFGLSDLHSRMNFADFFNGLQKGDTLWWLDTYVPADVNWYAELKEALERGVVVKMLVLSPECENASHRGGELRRPSFLRELQEFIDKLDDLASEYEGQFKYVLYDDLPCAPFYVVSRKGDPVYGFSSWFLEQPTGIEFPHFKWSSECEMLKHINNYVRAKWNRHNKVRIPVTPK